MGNRKSILLIIAILFLAGTPLFSGCALFLVGAGAAGGYAAIGEDEVEGFFDASYDRVWKSVRTTLQKEGALTLEDKTHGKIEALVGGSTVEAALNQVTKNSVSLRIKSRKTKGLFPDVETAQNLYNQVVKDFS